MEKRSDRADTGQFSIDEILGQKVSPVEPQVFESRTSRARLLLGATVMLAAGMSLVLAGIALVTFSQVVW